MSMGKRIKKARNDLGVTQEYVAFSLGVSRQAVYKWEKDQSKPDTENLIALSKLFGVSVEYLTKGEKKLYFEDRSPGGPFFLAGLLSLMVLPVCWMIGVFSGVYTDMVQIPITQGLRMGIPFLMYGSSPAALILIIVSIICLILFVLLLFLGHFANKKQ